MSQLYVGNFSRERWHWEPNEVYGPFLRGARVTRSMVADDEEFEKIGSAGLIQSSYDGIRLSETEGVLSSVFCSGECWLKGVNLIGQLIDEVPQLLDISEPILTEAIEEIYELHYVEQGLSMTADIMTERRVDQVQIRLRGQLSKRDLDFFISRHKRNEIKIRPTRT